MQSYPINLLLQNRLCLVIGGGPVALRKARRLLAADAKVKVVAPEAVAGLRELATDGRLELVLRKCQAEDLDGIFLLFLASDDHKFNQRILDEARSRRTLTCAVDENWSAGDFITPASCDGAGLQLAVATGGRSCIRSKSVKNFLAGQLETLAAKVVLNSFTISGEKQRNEFNPDLPDSVAASLKLITGVREFAVCYETGSFEIVALLSLDEGVSRLLRLILKDAVGETGAEIIERRGEEAFTYLFRKTSVAEGPRSFFINHRVDCRFGSGLNRLNSLLMQSETLKVDPGSGWQEYADYCRKL